MCCLCVIPAAPRAAQGLACLHQVDVFKSEKALLEAVVEAVQGLDPDIILGFEVQKASLGYLADRAATMEMGLLKLVSRTPQVQLLPTPCSLSEGSASCMQSCAELWHASFSKAAACLLAMSLFALMRLQQW